MPQPERGPDGAGGAPRSGPEEEPPRGPEGFRAGFVALLGLPNVGKSTLLNALVGGKLSIVTSRPQTTRRRVTGILTDEGHQAVFLDTPGLMEPRYALHHAMREEAGRAAVDADVLVRVVDAGFEPSLAEALDAGPDPERPSLACLNKVDRVGESERERIAGALSEAGWSGPFATVATEGTGVDRLREAVLAALPLSPPLYPEGDLSTEPVRFFVEELVRESCFESLEEEVPYGTAVRIREFREDDEPLYIAADVLVERDSQKGIVIGRGGSMIRAIGVSARRKVEAFLGRRVYLDLRVKVLPKWTRKSGALTRLGYDPPGR
ncbi:MAG TPA: GTPase Era [Gemmatimonadota bacterium]|nr:GTPase Era [Gemmatimonadota bacterium]